MFKPDPKKGMPPKKAKKPLKRSPFKKKYGKVNSAKASKVPRGLGHSEHENTKPVRKKQIAKRKNSIKKRVKKTGEIDVFFELVKEHGDETIYCRCCNKPLYSLSPINFSHVVPKSLSNILRLDKRNIWIVCEDCHVSWDAGDRNQPKFAEKRKLFEQLRIEDNANNR